MRRVYATCAMILVAAHAGAQTVWKVSQRPLVDIPDLADNGIVNFQRAVAGLRRADGTVVIMDERAGIIRLFTAKGVPIKAPTPSTPNGRLLGDTRGPRMIGTRCRGDSLLVVKTNSKSAVIVDPNGAKVRQFRLPSDSSIAGPTFTLLCLPSGKIAYSSDPDARMRQVGTSPLVYGTVELVVLDRHGRPELRLRDTALKSEWVRIVSRSGSRGQFMRPFGNFPYLTNLGDTIVFGMSDSSRFGFVAVGSGHSGEAVEPLRFQREIDLPLARQAYDSAALASSVEAIASLAPNQRVAEAALDQLGRTPRPSISPFLNGLFRDSQNLLWIQTSPFGAPMTSFTVVDRNGRRRATVSLPFRLSVFEIGQDYLFGTYMSGDVAHVAVFQLSRVEKRE